MDMTPEELQAAIIKGIKEAMPSESSIREAIKEAIADAFPYPSEILNAIYQGNRAAKGGE